MAFAGGLSRGTRGLGCRGAWLLRLGAENCQQLTAVPAASTAAVATCAPPPAAGPSAAQGWRRAYSTPAMEAWDSLRQSFSTIKVEAGDDGVAVLTIDRPQALNALNSQVTAPCGLPATTAPSWDDRGDRGAWLGSSRLAGPCICRSQSSVALQVMGEIVSCCLFLDRNHPAAKVRPRWLVRCCRQTMLPLHASLLLHGAQASSHRRPAGTRSSSSLGPGTRPLLLGRISRRWPRSHTPT